MACIACIACIRIKKMGASMSSNLATMLNNVSTDISTTTTVTENATNTCRNEMTLNGCDFESGGNIEFESGCDLINTVKQIGSVSNTSQLNNDVAMQLAQQSTSETGFLGIGLASAVNSSFTSSSISNTVSTISETTMNKINSADTTFSCQDSTMKASGDIKISNVNNLSLTGSQTGSTENLTDVSNTVSQTVSQTASATVSGFSFGFVVIIVAVIIALVAGKVVLDKQKGGSGVSGGSLRGGQVTTSLIFNTVGCLVIAGCLMGIGTMNMNNRTPCNNNGQCESSLWYAPSFGCSCTDHLTCGLNEPNHTPLSTGVPLLMITPMTNSSDTDTAYLRKMTVRGICGFDSSKPQANNSGYNIKNYIEMRKIATNSGVTQVKKIFEALFQFFKMHASAEGSDDDNNSDFTVMYDPSFLEGSNFSPNDYIPPCVNDIVLTLLPLTPYYMPPSDVVEKADATEANPQTADVTTTSGDPNSKPCTINTLSRPGPIRLTETNEYGAVNVAQHLCYKEDSVNVSASNNASIHFRRQDSSGNCPDGYTKIWSTNPMIKTTLYRNKNPNYPLILEQINKAVRINETPSCSDGYYYVYGTRDSSKSDFPSDNGWEEVTEPVQLQLDCNDPNSVVELRSSIASSWGSFPSNVNGSTDAAVGADFWPSSDNMSENSQSGWVTEGTKFSNFNMMYIQNNSEDDQRLPLQHVRGSTPTYLEDCFEGKTTDAFGSEVDKMMDNVDFYDGKNAAAYRAAVETNDGLRIGTFCQTFGTTVGGPSFTDMNESTRFIVHNNGQTRTLSSTAYSASSSYSDVQDVGFNKGDQLCRMGSGFSQYPGQYPYMTTMTAQKYDMTPDSVLNAILAKTPSTPGSTNGTIAAVANANQSFNAGPTLPLGDCLIQYNSDGNVKLCSDTTEYLSNCWNPELCKTMGGTWKVERDGIDPNLCADGYDVNLSSDGQDCYPGRCLTKDQVCSETNCQGCSTDECPTSNKMCKLVGASCETGCYPEAGLCTNCTEESECKAPCFYDTDRNTCTYGAQRCDQSQEDGNKPCCPDETDAIYYLVRIPDAFTSIGVGKESEAMNCSPGVFTPDPTATQGFNMTGSDDNTNNRYCGDTSDFASKPFTVNCAAEGSNCYGDTDNPSLFKVLSIPARPECFFDLSEEGVHYNTGADESPEMYCAIENRDAQQNWASENNGNKNGLAMWYMVNRIFSWTLLLQGTAKRQSYLTSILGLSTLLNDQGMNPDTNSPEVPLESVADIKNQLQNNSWARVQPLLFIVDGEYHFATLEDIAEGRCNEWWQDRYIRQINQFVYDAENSQFNADISVFAEAGIGDGFRDTIDIKSTLEQMDEYTGTLVGSTGSCNTLWSNDWIIYGSFGIAGIVVIGLVVMWTLAIRKN